MAIERTETGYEIFPEVKDIVLTVTEPATKGKTNKGKFYYVFKFKGVVEGRARKYSEAQMTWMAGDLLRALGCKEVGKGTFEWDKAEIVGRQVLVDIVHEEDFKDPSKMVARMKNIRPVSDAAEPEPEVGEPPEEPVGTPTDDIPF